MSKPKKKRQHKHRASSLRWFGGKWGQAFKCPLCKTTERGSIWMRCKKCGSTMVEQR